MRFSSNALRGAGSTFAQPLMRDWADEYRVFRQGGVAVRLAGGGLDDDIGGVALDYEAVGSQAGIARVKARAVDFAASEMPLPQNELEREALLQVPLVCGGVAVAANLREIAGRELRLSAALIADIFLGRVKTWSDAAIAQQNPDIKLPNAPIAVVHRADGSGTSFVFTQFLSQGSADWKAQVGSDLLVNWPVGEGFKGSTGVARALARTPNAIGYVNAAELGTGLITASVQNPAGRFVDADAQRGAIGGFGCAMAGGGGFQHLAGQHTRRRQLPDRGSRVRTGEPTQHRLSTRADTRVFRVVAGERPRGRGATGLHATAGYRGAAGADRVALMRLCVQNFRSVAD